MSRPASGRFSVCSSPSAVRNIGMSKDEPVLVDDANSATTTRTAQTLPRVLLSLKQSKDRWSHAVTNRMRTRLLKIHLLLLMVLTIVAVLGTVLYTHRENYIYYWDFSDYQDKTINLATKYSQYSLNRVDQWVQIIREFRGSTEQDYSYVPTAFTIPFVLLFGPSREEYIVSLTIFYLIPF